MFSFFYNLALFALGLIALPKILWQWLTLGKYRESLLARLGFRLPSANWSKDAFVIWIHAVSIGETRAVLSLYRLLLKNYPQAVIIVSSTTETGQSEAKRNMPEAAAHFFLPLDFSWVVSKVVSHFSPKHLILVESDFWYHLLKEVKAQGGSITLVNGKVSERSMSRFCKFPRLTKKIFKLFDALCVQSEHYKERFEKMGVDPQKIHVTGNLKFDAAPVRMGEIEKGRWKEELGITTEDRVLAIGSTHAPEEEWLLSALDSVWKEVPALKVLLIPRHPERFSSVADHLKARGISTVSYSKRNDKTGRERIVLIDAMGQLNHCYELAEIAIVGGSFISGIGGHNIFEPVMLDVPVIFGPHMENQPDLVKLVLKGSAGLQVTLEQLPGQVLKFLQDPALMNTFSQNCRTISREVQGSAQRTLEILSRKN